MSRSPGASRRMATSLGLSLCGLLLVTGLSGCGSSSESGTVVKDAGPRCAKVAKLATSKGKPTKVEAPRAPVTKLMTQDLRVGTGAQAVKGMQLTVNHLGITCSSGQEFDTSWGKKGKNKDDPLTFVLGAGTVIKGWDTGLVGMKVGGERRLVIPGSLAYGVQGQPPSIQSNDTLVFIVDLLKVAKAPPPTTTTTTTTTVPASTTTTTAAPKSGTTTTAAPTSGSTTTSR